VAGKRSLEAAVEIPIPDPRVALLAGVAASIASPRVRPVVGTGFGYAARGALAIGAPFIAAGRDIYGNARDVASAPKPPSPMESAGT
jgi:hypothetical protein